MDDRDTTRTTDFDPAACDAGFREVETADRAWAALVAAAKAFAPHLDQWEKIKFRTEHGMVFLSIGRQDLWPDSFEEVA